MIAKHVRKRRLHILIRYLQHLPKGRKFRQSTYGLHHGDHAPPDQNYCGTAACVLGHAAMIPAFRRAGLRLHWERRSLFWWAEISLNGRNWNCEAGKHFFGLTSDEAVSLFRGSHATRVQKIAELKRLLAATDTREEPDA